MNQEDIKQVEQFIRIGCAAAQQGKPLEESQQIGAVALGLIEKLKSVTTPKPE
jgi:hypothetical protein